MTVYRVRVSDEATPVPAEVMVEAEAASLTRDLVGALAELGFTSRPVRLRGMDITESTTVGELDLAHGDTLTCGGPAVRPAARQAGTYLLAVCGPDAGAFWCLTPNLSVAVGRKTPCECLLTDPLVSGRHLRVTLHADDHVEVEDLGSSNGSLLEGVPLSAPATVPPGGYVQIGATVLGVVKVAPDELPMIASTADPENPFQRRFRASRSPLPPSLRAPTLTHEDEPDHRGPLLTMLLLPLVTGIGFAVLSGSWWFLGIAALGPLLRLVEHRRRSRRDAQRREQQQARYRQQRADFDTRLAATLQEDRHRRREDALPGGVSALVAGLRHRRLWERTPADADFLSVCLGLASLPASVEVEDESGRSRPAQWATPLAVPLLQTGSLCIQGPRSRVQAVGRSVLFNLAVTHSPVELHLWVLTEDSQEAAWDLCRLLPHTYAGPSSSRIALGATDRLAAVSALRQVIDSRRELGDEPGVRLPVYVVVVDGTHLIESDDLTWLLTRGPGQGVIGIVLDPSVIPEGANGELKLGSMADDARFESSAQHRLEGVVTAELAPTWAASAARQLAGLRPSAGAEVGSVRGEVRLTELVGLSPPRADAVLQRWQAHSPSSRAVVGIASGSPQPVDLVAHGPHGLIGGTTRSGKTEFIQTLLASLCLENHPDDLSLLLVDFKGGVDHANTAKLPHVLELITNDDIDRFERTVRMLQAEQVRRQQIFRAAEVSNLDGYRAARAANSALQPVPRLVVIADEFGELLSSEVGRTHLSALESVARVGGGLGINLLLITQNFVGQLPDQIAGNAGLRICFRVEEGAHSKIVLDSDVAVSVSASHPGRAWGRLRGGDLFEFQAARVANRRNDLDTAHPKVSVTLSPLGALASATPQQVGGSVPYPETDLLALNESMTAAATRSGWREQAIPWPKQLPVDLTLAEVIEADHTTPVIGLIDRPDEQRRDAYDLDAGAEQLLVLGGNRARTCDILLTVAVAAALRRSPEQLHLYAIDVTGTELVPLDMLAHCGGVAARNDELAARILRHLGDEAARRRARATISGGWDGDEPELLLVIDGADRLIGSSTEGAPSPLLGPLVRLLGDAVGVGIRVVVAGGTRLAQHRIATGFERRLVLRCSDPSDYASLGVPKQATSDLMQPLRAYDTSRELLCQFARVAPEGVSTREVIAAIAEAPHRRTGGTRATGPIPIADVAWPLTAAQLDLDALREPQGFHCGLPLGVDTATGRYLWVDAPEDGPVIGVSGGGKSGRSTALRTVGGFARRLGWEVVAWAGSRRSPLPAAAAAQGAAVVDTEAALLAAIPASRRALVLLDDANRLELELRGLAELLSERDDLLVLLAAPPPFLGGRSELTRSLPTIRSFLVLAPRSGSEGIALGLSRFSDEQVLDPRPGRGMYVAAGEVTDVQVPLP